MKIVEKYLDKGFRAVPNADVQPGTIYVPRADEAFFGIADDYIKAGELGNFSARGVYMFQKPVWWYDEIGQPIFWKRQTETTGVLTNSQISSVRSKALESENVIVYGAIACVITGSQIQIGWQVEGPQPNQLYVYLSPNSKLVSSYDAYVTRNIQ